MVTKAAVEMMILAVHITCYGAAYGHCLGSRKNRKEKALRHNGIEYLIEAEACGAVQHHLAALGRGEPEKII